MSEDLSEEELKEIRDQFHAIDLDGNGRITVAELQTAMQKVGGGKDAAALDKIAKMMEAADLDGDGELDFDVCLHSLGVCRSQLL